MPTLTTQMTEMKGARVDRISLVSKAASRIPFRVIKEDRTMQNPLKTLDLAQVWKGKKADPVPTIVGVVTMKGDTFEAVKKAAQDAGFKVDAVEESKDGSVVLKQGEVAEGDKLVIIKMGDTMAVAMKGFAPYNCNLNVTGADDTAVSFAEMCTAQGFYPDVSTVMDVLQSSVMQAAYKAEDPKSAAETVAKMFDEAKTYAVSLMSALPAACFKMEKAMKSGAPNANGSMATANPPVVGTDTTTSSLGGAKEKDPLAGAAPGSENAASGTGDGAGVAKGAKVDAEDRKDGGADEAAEDAAKKAKIKKAEEEAAAAANVTVFGKLMEESLKALGTQFTTQLTQAVGQVQKSVDDVKTSVEGLTTKVGEVEGVAKAAQKAVAGTVLGSGAGADATLTQKSEQGGRGREIDTAFAPRRRAAR